MLRTGTYRALSALIRAISANRAKDAPESTEVGVWGAAERKAPLSVRYSARQIVGPPF